MKNLLKKLRNEKFLKISALYTVQSNCTAIKGKTVKEIIPLLLKDPKGISNILQYSKTSILCLLHYAGLLLSNNKCNEEFCQNQFDKIYKVIMKGSLSKKRKIKII